MSDDLIAQFSTDLRPVAPAAMRNRLLMWLAAGVVLSAVLMLAWLGLRPDLAVAVGMPVFWAKFAFTSWMALSWVDHTVWRRVVPKGWFYNVMVTGAKPS